MWCKKYLFNFVKTSFAVVTFIITIIFIKTCNNNIKVDFSIIHFPFLDKNKRKFLLTNTKQHQKCTVCVYGVVIASRHSSCHMKFITKCISSRTQGKAIWKSCVLCIYLHWNWLAFIVVAFEDVCSEEDRILVFHWSVAHNFPI